MPTLRINSKIQTYADIVPGQLSEPLMRYCDWERLASGIPVREVISDCRVVSPGTTLSLASVSVISGIAPSVLYSLKAHATKTDRYQIRYQSGGTGNPLVGLGTGLASISNTYVVTLNTNGSINLVDNSVSPVNFGLARADKVYIAGSDFGDTGPFSSLNQGFWEVVSCSAFGSNPGAKLVLSRINITDELGVAETVTAAATLNIQKVTKVSSALIIGAPAYAGIWTVTESASGWFSVDSVNTLPDLLSVTLTALTLSLGEFLGFARVESDGIAVVNSTSGDLTQGSIVLRPVIFSDPLAVSVGGWTEIHGLLTALSVQNVSDQDINVNVILGYMAS